MANLKSVLKCWTEFNLPALQESNSVAIAAFIFEQTIKQLKSLDQTATETAQRQDEAEKGKKILIDLTKDWRRNTEEEVRTKCSGIVKAFQKEIDTLNKRSKAAENSFLMLYKHILEIPDPVPSLKKADVIQKQLEKSKDLELENQKLRETLNEYHSEFAEVKNQEVTLNKLKEKIKGYEGQSEDKLKVLLEERGKQLQKEFEDREQQLLDSKLNVAKKLGDSEAKIKFLTEELEKARHDIFDLKGKHDEEVMGRVSEINMLEMDLERANQHLLSSEKYSDSLKTQITDSSHPNVSGQGSCDADVELIKSLEFQLSSKERELSQLMEEVHHLQATNVRSKAKFEKEIYEIEKQLEESNQLVSTLEEKLRQQADYVEIKREINVLKMIEFSAVEGKTSDEGGDAKPLEKLLLEKNKSLLSESTLLKVQNGELRGKNDELQRNCSEAYRTVKEQKELIVQLESDLSSVRGLPSSLFRGEGVGAPSTPSNTELVTKAIQDINLDIDQDEEDITNIKTKSDSLLPIIQSQRERFRTRNLELETQTRQQQQQIISLQNEADTIRQDNVKLYEKIKFLQSYPNKSKSTMNVDDDSVKRYSNQYEQGIDPFSVFSRKEKQQRYANLSAPEKVTLNMGRFILSNKIARTLVFFYTIMLHLLVFVVLYKFSFYESTCVTPLQDAIGRRDAVHENPMPGYQHGKPPPR